MIQGKGIITRVPNHLSKRGRAGVGHKLQKNNQPHETNSINLRQTLSAAAMA
jgi:hypothetical protein